MAHSHEILHLILIVCLIVNQSSASLEETVAKLFEEESKDTIPLDAAAVTQLLRRLPQMPNFDGAEKIGDVSKSDLVALADAGRIDPSQCNHEAIEARRELERKYGRKFVHLKAYLTFVNELQFNLCIQSYEASFIDRLIAAPAKLLTALYEFTRSIDEAPIKEDEVENFIASELRSGADLDPETRERVKLRAINIAHYLNLHRSSIRREDFESDSVYEIEMKSAYTELTDEVCDKLYNPVSQDDARLRDQLSSLQSPQDRNKISKDLARFCRRSPDDLVVTETLNEILPALRRILHDPVVESPPPTDVDDMDAKLLEFTVNHMFRAMSLEDTQQVISLAAHLSPDDAPQTIRELHSLGEMSQEGCSSQRLMVGLKLERRFTARYKNLFIYVKVANLKQSELCLVSVKLELGQLASRLHIEQLARLERLHESISKFSEQPIFSKKSLHDHSYGSGLLEFVEQDLKQLPRSRERFLLKSKRIMDETCRDVANEDLADRFRLWWYVMQRKFGPTSLKLVSYVRICSFYQKHGLPESEISLRCQKLKKTSDSTGNPVKSILRWFC